MRELTPRKIKRYGWRRGLPDQRHLKYADYFAGHAFMLPPSVDLRPYDNPVYDQGSLGSCTANSTAGMCEYVTKHLNKKWLYVGSRLFIYYNERVLEGDVGQDAGASLSDGMTVIHKLGVPNEKNWPYDVAKFTDKPPVSVYANGLQHIAGPAFELDNTKIIQLKNCLSAGYPFVFGFTVYESFESDVVAATGIVPMPKKTEEQLGGHAVMAVGYDDSKQWIIVRNSWGADWGEKGYFFLPYQYISSPDLADECFTIRTIG